MRKTPPTSSHKTSRRSTITVIAPFVSLREYFVMRRVHEKEIVMWSIKNAPKIALWTMPTPWGNFKRFINHWPTAPPYCGSFSLFFFLFVPFFVFSSGSVYFWRYGVSALSLTRCKLMLKIENTKRPTLWSPNRLLAKQMTMEQFNFLGPTTCP